MMQAAHSSEITEISQITGSSNIDTTAKPSNPVR
jgi:hypothetical protein